MSFIADQQTLNDLGLLGKFNPGSIFSLFNRVKTRGGEQLLDSLFQHPLTDADQINTRSDTFRYFGEHPVTFPFTRELLDQMEVYLFEGGQSSFPAALLRISRKKLMQVTMRDDAFAAQLLGINACVQVLRHCAALLRYLEQQGQDKHAVWAGRAKQLRAVLHDSRFEKVLAAPDTPDRSFWLTVQWHHLFAHACNEPLKAVLTLLYEIDVYLAVSGVAKEKGFAYGHACAKEKNVLEIQGVRHPRLEKAVANSLSFSAGSNVLFLTGANMAGKSTLMKSTGILLYLAHMGFPVAADGLTFSVLDGLYSSVNVPDDLNRGYSHFYAEVLRVKKVAEEVDSEKRLFVIFDELFKGTNVKDAYDATLAVTAAFADFRECFFIISTHIIEVGEALGETEDSVQFVFLPTVMEGTVPRYTYRLQEGITEDRQGMMIIENEGILGML